MIKSKTTEFCPPPRKRRTKQDFDYLALHYSIQECMNLDNAKSFLLLLKRKNEKMMHT